MIITTCQHPECLDRVRPYRGRGPRPAYCPEHSKPRYRMARSRAGIDLRPECCKAQGKGMCQQHRKPREHNYARELHPASILGSPEETEAQIDDVSRLGLRISSPWGAVSGKGITWGRDHHPVIGQRDLTCDWRPINPEWRKGVEGEFPEVKPKLVTLVWRGPEWPWAEVPAGGQLPEAA